MSKNVTLKEAGCFSELFFSVAGRIGESGRPLTPIAEARQ